MRKAGLAVLACAAVLWTTPAHAAGTDDATLHRYAGDTWASFVAMVDTAQRAAHRPAARRRQHRRADVDDEHRRLHVERRRRRAARRSSATPSWSPGLRTTIGDARAHGAPPARRPVLQLVRPPRRREAHDLAADRRPAGPDPVLGRQRLARDRAADRATAVPELSPGPARSTTRWTSASTTCPTRTASCSTTHPPPAPARAATTRVVSESRIADYIGIAKGELPRKEYYGRWRSFPDTCDCRFAGDAARAGSPAPTTASSVYDGSYPYGGTRLTPSWGGSMFEALMPALFVPEERWGAGLVAAEPPAHRRRADRPRPERGRLRHLGLLARPTSPRAATAATASTRSAWTPTATRPTRTTRSSTAASPAAPGRPGSPTRRRARTRTASSRRTPRSSRCATGRARRIADLARLEAIPGVYGQWGFRDSVNVGTGPVVRRLPVARPGDDHGRARQRARRRRAAAARSRRRDVHAGDPAGGRRRGVQRPAARLHDHRHGGRRRS